VLHEPAVVFFFFGMWKLSGNVEQQQRCDKQGVCGRYDVEAVRMVRRFKGHRDRVTGVVISQDARWLLSSSMDGTVRVWDIPAASCLQVTTPCVNNS